MKRVISAAGKHINWAIASAVALLFSFFMMITIFNAFYEYKEQTGSIIANEIERLGQIMSAIDQTAGILGFDEQKNRIDFLTIKKGGFVSSEVGSMNLIHPDKWQGPYVDKTPTIQNKEYQIVRTKKGYFIAPGDGVKLPNKKIIGTDIILDEQADIAQLARDEQALMFEGKPLAVPLIIKGRSFGL